VCEILHLSQTDINSDSRILKEMNSIAELIGIPDIRINGLGVSMNNGAAITENSHSLIIETILLKSRNFHFFPRGIRHICELIELTVKMFLKAINKSPKVVHCHDTLVLPLGVILKYYTGANLIYDAHELESDRNGLSHLLGKLTLYVEKILWRFIDGLITVSPSIDRWYNKNIGYKFSKVILNSPILGEEDQDIDQSYLRNKFTIDKDSKIFIYIGILTSGRGIDLVVEAFKNSDIKSSIVFLGYGDLSNDLKDLANNYQNIYVHDAVPHEQVVSVAKSADYGLCLIQNVSLSDYYCMPNKLFEYCFAGIPVLASNLPDLKNTVNKYRLGTCCELNLDSVIDGIKRLEGSEVKMYFKRDDLYTLSWDAQEKKLLDLYNYVLSEENVSV
jgi:glycosyltransferase involved in cell wall biosynthesis